MMTVGTCGKCGGPVKYSEFWGGPNPPRPSCQQCGRSPKESFGRVLDMDEGSKAESDLLEQLNKNLTTAPKR